MDDTINSKLYDKLARLQWLLHKQQVKTYTTSGPMADTSRGQGRILAVLRMKDGISTRDLSYLLGIRVSSLNELLAKLEKAGYITRQPSEEDKRIILIHLTEQGRREQGPMQDPADIFGCLTDEEQQHFGAYLDRLIEALEAELGSDSERDGISQWMKAARERMGDEPFERLMSMGSGFAGIFGSRRHGRHSEGRRNGFDWNCHGKWTANWEGPEDFAPDDEAPAPTSTEDTHVDEGQQ